MRVISVGAGGVVAPFAADLAAAGAAVSFLARGPTAAALRRSGLIVHGAGAPRRLVPEAVAEDARELGMADIVLVGCKMWDLAALAPALGRLGATGARLVTLQNGVDAPDVLRALLPGAAIAAGTALVNAEVEAPGVVRQHGTAQRLAFGIEGVPDDPVLPRFRDLCRAAGFGAELVPDPRRALWEKFVGLVGVAGLTALTRLPIGVVRSRAETRTLLLSAIREAAAVGRADGVDLPDEVVEARIAYVDAMPPGATASMAKDIVAGRRLELPWLNARVAALGRARGVPTPVNDLVSAALAPHADGAPAPGVAA